jgi:hypothetical protein
MCEGRSADIADKRVTVTGDAGLDVRGKPDLGARRWRLGAVAGGEEDGWREQRTAAAPKRVAVDVESDHEADVGMGISVELAARCNGECGSACEGQGLRRIRTSGSCRA